jgi:hypothetical protein
MILPTIRIGTGTGTRTRTGTPTEKKGKFIINKNAHLKIKEYSVVSIVLEGSIDLAYGISEMNYENDNNKISITKLTSKLIDHIFILKIVDDSITYLYDSSIDNTHMTIVDDNTIIDFNQSKYKIDPKTVSIELPITFEHEWKNQEILLELYVILPDSNNYDGEASLLSVNLNKLK